MALGTFLGRPSTERHEHYDADGNLTGTTVVTRESDWTDDDREAAWALWQDDLERCPDCGRPSSECSDPDQPWYPQRRICWATAAREVAMRRWHKLHEKDEPGADGFKAGDGMAVWMATEDLTPDEDIDDWD